MPKAEIEVQEKQSPVTVNVDGLQFDRSDINIPRMNVVQKTSDIEAPTGSLVLDKKFVHLKPEEIGQVVIISAVKQWKEDIPFDEGTMGRIASTPEAAVKLGQESSYPILEFAEIEMLLRQPEDSTNDEAYPYPIGDGNYAIGKLYVAKDAYRHTYKRLVTFAAFNKSIQLRNRLWNFQSQMIEKGKYSWYVPSLAISQTETPAEVLEFIEIFNG